MMLPIVLALSVDSGPSKLEENEEFLNAEP